MPDCPFCSLDRFTPWMTSPVALALWDGFPVTEGHTLVIPRRHVASLFELPPEILAEVWAFAGEVQAALRQRLGISDFNLGLNDGPLAGQTVPHAHIHLIPRRAGDLPDPRGGVRWVIPHKADYWSAK